MDDAGATDSWAAEEFDGDAHTRNDPETPVEHRFLLRLRDNPDDLAMRMVFADWLEETAQVEKAETVRLLAEVPVEGSPTMTRLRMLGTTVDREWMAIVSRAPIDKCPTTNLQFRYQCPKSWEALTSTDDATIRFCNQCNQNVYFCSSVAEVRDHATNDHCVAFSPRLARTVALQEYDRTSFELEGPTNPGFDPNNFDSITDEHLVMGEMSPMLPPPPIGPRDDGDSE